MADKSEEINVINHLLEVERNAATLIDEALQESEKRLAKARSEYNAAFKEKYDAGVAEIEKKHNASVEEIKAVYEKNVSEYKADLENKNQNTKSFNTLLDKLFFGAKD